VAGALLRGDAGLTADLSRRWAGAFRGEAHDLFAEHFANTFANAFANTFPFDGLSYDAIADCEAHEDALGLPYGLSYFKGTDNVPYSLSYYEVPNTRAYF
jgi:hypothetical protein